MSRPQTMAGACALALGLLGAAGIANGAPRACDVGAGGGSTMSNRHEITRGAGDATSVTQTVSPGSRGNRQSATTSSPDGSSTVVQHIDGDCNVQSVEQSGAGHRAVQTQTGRGNVQSIRQSGSGNVAVQSQGGRRLASAIDQSGNETDVHNQR